MGTNYYHRTKICPVCERYKETHIGKDSGGWTFSFQGADKIESWKDWQFTLLDEDDLIVDEYGKKHSVNWFVELVETKKSNKLNFYHYCELYYPNNLENQWLDDEGNSFRQGEFS